MLQGPRLLSNMFDRLQQQNYTYSTTSTFQINDEIIWLEAVYNALHYETSAEAISVADKVLDAYRKRFCTDTDTDNTEEKE